MITSSSFPKPLGVSTQPKSSFTSSQSLVEIAPTGVSSWSGPQIEMKHASGDSLRVHLRIPLCSIGLEDSASTANLGNGWNAMVMNTRTSYGASGTLRVVESLCLSPTIMPCLRSGLATTNWTEYIANPDCSLINLLASGFSKYRVASDLTLHYLPQTTTVDPANFALAFSDDPMHPQLGMAAYTTNTGSTYPSFATTKNSVNSVVFASWSTWSKKFPIDKNAVYFTTTPYATLGSSAVSTTPPFKDDELRFSHFGVLQCYASEKNTATTFAIKGELYMELSIEFFDFVPIAGASNVPFSLTDWGIFTDLVKSKNLPCLGDDDELGIKVSDSKEPIDEHQPEFEGNVAKMLSQFSRKPIFHREPPTIARSGMYKHTKSLGVRISRPQTLRSIAAPKVVRKVTLSHVINHLNRHSLRLPKKARPRLKQINELHAKQPKGWQDTTKSVIKSLVKEVPVVGSILGEVTDLVGGPILDWISKLF